MAAYLQAGPRIIDRARSALAILVTTLTLMSAAGCGGSGKPSDSRYLPVTFDSLSGFEVPEGGGAPRAGEGSSPLPPAIARLDGREVVVTGYMLPIDYEVGGSNHFVLLPRTGAAAEEEIPRVNEWIDVSVKDGRRVPFRANEPVRVFGRMRVKLEVSGGNAVGLYRLEAEKVVTLKP